ncbi:MAG: hypothetical protein H7A45_09805 [Verrucomicrobiales bacterium]|nr:hypothetical protein [Verrucomicrobiales bacterium]MCP5526303.1 hypothetical protein [Verrucomicrobiales bacterium]
MTSLTHYDHPLKRPARVVHGWLLSLGLAWGALSGVGGQASSSRTVAPDELGYSVRLWTVEDGVPANFIDFLAQTPDGYLWWPTAWGVGRFDGVRFQSFPIPDADGRTQQMDGLFRDSRGRLWVWNSRRTIGTIEAGNYVSRDESSSRPGPYGIDESPDGRIWLSQQDPDGRRFLECIEGGNLERRAVPPNSGFTTKSHLDADGTLWLWDSGRLYRAEANAAVPVALSLPRGQPDSLASMFFRLAHGEVGVVGRGGIHELVQGRWQSRRSFPVPLPDRINMQRAAADQLGNVWIGTRASGLWVATGDGQTLEVTLPGLTYPDGFGIGAVLTDQENDVWIGTRSGLYQLQRAPFRRVLPSEPLARSEPVDLAEDCGGGLWVLTESGQALRYAANGAYRESVDGLPELSFIEADSSGPVWLASRHQVWRWTPDDLVPLEILDGNEAGQRYFVGMKAVGGILWAYSGSGLLRSVNDQLVPQAFAVSSEDPGLVLFHANAQGEAAALVPALGLVRYQQDRWEAPPAIPTMPVQDFIGMRVDTQARTWTFGSNPPLMRHERTHWEEVSLGTSEMPISVLALESDDQGNLWGLTAEHGVFRLAPGRQEATEGAIQWLGVANGLPSNAGRGWGKGMLKSRDGRIWVATARGVAVIDPAQWETERQALGIPQVHVEEVHLDDLALPRETDGSVVVPPGRNRLEIRFTALGLNNARANRFKYQLSGVDADLQDAGTTRVAVYHRMPPGRHRFRVIAANCFGVWNHEGATLAVTVLPAWWQRVSVHVAGWCLLIGTAALFYRWRLRQFERRRAQQERFSRQLIRSQEDERQRIAGDLHDGLGQDLLAAKNLALLAAMRPPAVEETAGRFREISDAIGSAVEVMRGISRALRPVELDSLGLTRAIEAALHRVESGSAIRVISSLADIDGRLPPEDEISLYRLIQEALSNAMKHSGARVLRCAVNIQNDCMRVEIADNGHGFDPAQVRARGRIGLGLLGMEERARLMRGELVIDSGKGQGTRLIITVPTSRRQQHE